MVGRGAPSDSSSDGSSGPSASTDLTETDLYAEPSASSHSAPSTKSSHRENLFVVMGVGVLTVLALSAVAVLVRRSLTAQVPPTQGYGAVASTSQGNEML